MRPHPPDPDTMSLLGGEALRVERHLRGRYTLEHVFYESEEDRLRVVLISPAKGSAPQVQEWRRSHEYQITRWRRTGRNFG